MGVVVREEYVCDYCGKPITSGEVLVGRLALRRQGSRGLAKDFALAFHPRCSEKLTQHASSAPKQRKQPPQA